MSYVIAAPEMMTAFASDRASIGSTSARPTQRQQYRPSRWYPPPPMRSRWGSRSSSPSTPRTFTRSAGRATAFHEQLCAEHEKPAPPRTPAPEDAITWSLAGGATSGPLAQELGSVAQELFSFVAAVVFAALVVGFFAVAVPIVAGRAK